MSSSFGWLQASMRVWIGDLCVPSCRNLGVGRRLLREVFYGFVGNLDSLLIGVARAERLVVER